MKKIIHYNKKHEELVIKMYCFKYFRYLVITFNIKSWAFPLHIQRFVWYLKKDVEWYVWFLCFMFSFNNYGSLIQDEDWPKEW